MKVKMVMPIMLFVLMTTTYGQDNSKNSANKPSEMKETVKNYFMQLYSLDYEKAMNKNLAKNYVEHQETADFSAVGLKEFIKKRVKKYPDLKIIIHRIIEQDNYIFLHVEEKISEKLTFVHGELFRIENSLIVEHWSAIQKHPKKLKSGRRMYDGQGIDYSKNSGLQYAELTKQSYLDAFTLSVDQAVKVIDETTTNRYYQHNPSVVDGKEAFMKAPATLNKISKIGLKTTLDIKMTISEGDYVVTFAYFRLPLIAGNSVLFDLFRLKDDGKKDEHWDVGEKFKKKNMDKVF